MPEPATRKSDRTTGQEASLREPLSVRPDTLGPSYVPFLLGASQERIGGALGLSVVSHVVVFGLILLLLSISPEPRTDAFEPNLRNYGLVWIPQEGLGGGGGGGGNESLEVPREAELPGEDEMTVPIEEEPEFEEPAEEEQPPPEWDLNISALPMASAAETLPGILEGLSALSMEFQGPGVWSGAGAGEGAGIGPGEGAGLGPGEGGGSGGGVYRPGSGVESPRVIREVTPKYTAEAMRAKVQGVVWLDAVVLADGTVGDVQVTKSLDPVFGLDAEAIKAARQWRFVPGTRFGEPVAVLVTIELTFTLR